MGVGGSSYRRPMAEVGDVVPSMAGGWMVVPPTRCGAGHVLGPRHCWVGHHPCNCGGHLGWACECGHTTYAPPLGENCCLLSGAADPRIYRRGNDDR